MEIEAKLRSLGLELPTPSGPAGTYISLVQVGEIMFVGGTIGRFDGEPLKFSGKVGADVTVEQAYEMAQRCGLNHLAKIRAALGDLDRVERIVKVNGYVNAAPGFIQLPQVVNGESDLYVKLWGEKGEHTRAAVGVAELSANAAVETEVIVQVKT